MANLSAAYVLKKNMNIAVKKMSARWIPHLLSDESNSTK